MPSRKPATGQKERKDYAEPLDQGRTGFRGALQDLPNGEHTNYTLGWLGQDWSCSGTALYAFLSPTEAVAGAFLLLLQLLCPLHLCSPSTSVPTLVKATTSLLPLASALPNFLFQTMIIHVLHGASSIYHLLILAFTVSPLCYPYSSYKDLSLSLSCSPRSTCQTARASSGSQTLSFMVKTF